MHCPNCKQNVDFKRYCTKCGYRLHSMDTNSTKIFDTRESKEDFFKTWIYIIVLIIFIVICANIGHLFY